MQDHRFAALLGATVIFAESAHVFSVFEVFVINRGAIEPCELGGLETTDLDLIY